MYPSLTVYTITIRIFPYPWLFVTTLRSQHDFTLTHRIFLLSFCTTNSAIAHGVWFGKTAAVTIFERFANVVRAMASRAVPAFGEFCVWNYFTGTRTVPGTYPEASALPLINIERTHSSYPASGTSTHAPEPLGSNYIVFNVPGGATGPLTVTFDGADGTNWVANLVIPTGFSFTAHRFSLNSLDTATSL
jgi:hypothetical protein